MILESQCFEYFKSVNPLAQKIGEDIEKIAANRENWNTLDSKDKDKILDQSLIDVGLVKKYESKLEQEDEESYSELSTFSWFTKSQLNLFSFINTRPERSRTPMKKTSDVLSPLKKGKAPPVPGGPKAVETGPRSTKTRPTKEEKLCPKKPKTPPPPPPAKLVPAEQSQRHQDPNAHGDDIPKTGFDFLDNW